MEPQCLGDGEGSARADDVGDDDDDDDENGQKVQFDF